MKRLIGILQFMTRLPIPVDTGFDEEFHKGIIYFPIVGVVLGIFYYLSAVIGQLIFGDYIASVLVLIAECILTGGLHLDGLGDTFDGLYSYRDKERILEIMKDSRLGTNGLLAIMLVYMLKLGLIYSLLTTGGQISLLIMPIVARGMQVVSCYKTTTPREKGMGNIFIGKVELKTLLAVYGQMLLFMMVASILSGGIHMIGNGVFYGMQLAQCVGILLVMSLFTKGFIHSVYKKIDGITGDILGCICELSEVVYLMLVYILATSFLH